MVRTTDESRLAAALPPCVAELFWEYRPGAVSLAEHLDLVVRKVLVSGSWDSILWLRQQVGDPKIREWIVDKGVRFLDRRRLRFWQVVLRIPEDVLQESARQPGPDDWNRRRVDGTPL